MNNALFCKEEVNTGRQACIDFAKVLAIVFMVFSHPFLYTDLDTTSGLPFFIMFIGSHQFAAPLFMTCMGLGIAYSRHNDPKSIIRRGSTLFIASILLNLIRSMSTMTVFLFNDSEFALHWTVKEIVIVDILQFAGLGMILFGLLKMLHVPYWGSMLLALVMSVCGSQLHIIHTGNNLLDSILGLFVGICGEYCESYFPLLNWFIFIVFGYGLGYTLRRCKDLKRFFAMAVPIAAAVYFAYLLYAIPHGFGMFDTSSDLNFYQIRTYDVLVCANAVLMMIGTGYFVMNAVPVGVQEWFSRIAKDLVRIYILQWLIIMWVMYALMKLILGVEFTVPITILTGFCVLVSSTLLARVKPFSQLKL
jgi:uncharacterized membrane protein